MRSRTGILRERTMGTAIKRATKTKAKVETVLVLRTCNADMTSRGGFKWPESGPVACSDFKATYKCGSGLHGLLWGEGDASYPSWEPTAKWIVVKVLASELLIGQGDLIDKCKFPRGAVVHCGDKASAAKYIADNGGAGKKIIGATVTGGDDATVTGGYRATVTGGDDAALSLEYYDASIGNYRRCIGLVGENGIQPNKKYHVIGSRFVEVQ
jgi:hypothetical protein